MYLWIFISGVVFAFYNSWGIGANDCANSFATSVGAKVLTLRQAVIIAGVFEFCGAVFMGSHVTSTVRKKIVDIDIFIDNPGALMYGMLCADASSAIWLTFATYFKLPVSTTHSIIGAIVGFSLAYGGKNAVNWKKIWLVIASWVASPFIAGIISSIFFYCMNRFIFQTNNSYRYTLYVFPVLTFFTFFINSLFIIYKGSPQLELDETPLWLSIVVSIGIGLVTSIMTQIIYIPYVKNKINKKSLLKTDSEQPTLEGATQTESSSLAIEGATQTESNIDDESVKSNNSLENTDSYIEAINNNSVENSSSNEHNFTYNPDLDIDKNIDNSKQVVKYLEKKKYNDKIDKLHVYSHSINDDSEQLCSWIQIITACFSAFAHGSNDVANSIAPLATIFHIYENNYVSKKSDVPIWILVLGAIGIVIGLSTWGYKIIDRIGRELTKISPSRGFIIELSAALTIIIASRAEIPVSTTHCQVGSVVGCGLVGGVKNIQWNILRKIVFSWLITLPVTGLLSAGLFSFGYYSPSDNDITDSLISGSGL